MPDSFFWHYWQLALIWFMNLQTLFLCWTHHLTINASFKLANSFTLPHSPSNLGQRSTWRTFYTHLINESCVFCKGWNLIHPIHVCCILFCLVFCHLCRVFLVALVNILCSLDEDKCLCGLNEHWDLTFPLDRQSFNKHWGRGSNNIFTGLPGNC